MKYITGKSFLFISLKEKFDLAFADLSILFRIQSLLFSTVAPNATPTRLAERSRVTYGRSKTLHPFLVTWVWAACGKTRVIELCSETKNSSS